MNASTAHYSLLVVDDEPDLRTLYELTLLREGYEVETAGSVEDALARLECRAYSALITDMRLPDGSGLELLHALEQRSRREKAIVITAYGSAENAVEALKAGAFDYLTKPVDLKQFRAIVSSALGRSAAGAGAATPAVPVPAGANKPKAAASQAGRALGRMAGQSPAMQEVRALVEKVARSMAPVLVTGESGTGKELVAHAIHEVSPRAHLPFVAVNCSAIPEHLLEAEFFGYRKGAFTGANEDREGFFQAANGGTLFLDEIGDLPLAMQSKLLRAIQERAVRPVGAVAEQSVNVRLLSATHKDLAAEVQSGAFRQDLFYRLNVIQIQVPPLRERLQDLPEICGQVLERIARDAALPSAPRLTAEAVQRLCRYAFPGNVRELENLLHRAVALTGGESIDAVDLGLPPPAGVNAPVEAQAHVPAAQMDPAELRSTKANLAGPELAEAGFLPDNLEAYLDNVEREILNRALEQHRYNRTAAGLSLGLSLRQIRYRMARLGVQVGSDPDPAESLRPEDAP